MWRNESGCIGANSVAVQCPNKYLTPMRDVLAGDEAIEVRQRAEAEQRERSSHVPCDQPTPVAAKHDSRHETRHRLYSPTESHKRPPARTVSTTHCAIHAPISI